MAKRRRIALVYEYNENWIGGTYYIENLIAALKTLPENTQPELFIFLSKPEDFEKLKIRLSYTRVRRMDYSIKLSLVKRAINKLTGSSKGFYFFKPYHQNIDVVFPADVNHNFLPEAKKIYWIPDFQEHYLPEYFTLQELEWRKKCQQATIQNGRYIVFSSNAARRDFNEIYPHSSMQQFVVPFAVSHNLSVGNLNLTEKYHLPEKFFICCNQLWKHKNHIIIIETIALLKQKGINIFVVFTGQEHDYRNPGFLEEIKYLVATKGLENNIAFLGFIDRADQLELMKMSIAVIQPSLFEGWSTVIEDAKSLGVPIIASSIEVHKEQLSSYVDFLIFDPGDAEALASCISNISKSKRNIKYSYESKVQHFGKAFLSVVENIMTDN